MFPKDQDDILKYVVSSTTKYLEFALIEERKNIFRFKKLESENGKKYTSVAASSLVLVEILILTMSYPFY